MTNPAPTAQQTHLLHSDACYHQRIMLKGFIQVSIRNQVLSSLEKSKNWYFGILSKRDASSEISSLLLNHQNNKNIGY